jgi:hypothetical protein
MPDSPRCSRPIPCLVLVPPLCNACSCTNRKTRAKFHIKILCGIFSLLFVSFYLLSVSFQLFLFSFYSASVLFLTLSCASSAHADMGLLTIAPRATIPGTWYFHLDFGLMFRFENLGSWDARMGECRRYIAGEWNLNLSWRNIALHFQRHVSCCITLRSFSPFEWDNEVSFLY